MRNIRMQHVFRLSVFYAFILLITFDIMAKDLKRDNNAFSTKNDLLYSDKIKPKNNDDYYLTTKINLYVGYNDSEEWRLSYFPYKRYNYFLNLNYQIYTSFSPVIDKATYGLLNEFGINTAQIYYKLGLIYYFNSSFYLNGNIGLGFTRFLGGTIVNDMIIGAKFKIKKNIFLQIEGGANNIIYTGLPFNLFLKVGIGFDL